MTVHAVRLFVEPPKGDAESAIGNWVSNHSEWTSDPVDHSLTETTAGLDGSGTTYVRGDYRFQQDTPATDLLDDLEDRLSSMQGGLWARIGLHYCDHDEDNPTGCSWTGESSEVREVGDVPSDIPNLK
jgi:hypothetical protein